MNSPSSPPNSPPNAPKIRPTETPDDLPIKENVERFMPYLEEIQRKLFQVLVVFFASGLIGGIYYQEILRTVMNLFNLSGVNLVMTNPYQFISLAVNTGLIVGAITSLPLLFYHAITFLRPALLPQEFAIVSRLIPTAVGLFITGFAFGVWVVQFVITLFSKTTLEFAVDNLWDIGHFFSQIILTGLILALVFQLPIIVTALVRLNLVSHHTLTRQRRYIYAALMLIGALMPPTDIISLILLTVPPLLLFEIALVLNHPRRLDLPPREQ